VFDLRDLGWFSECLERDVAVPVVVQLHRLALDARPMSSAERSRISSASMSDARRNLREKSRCRKPELVRGEPLDAGRHR
jgi:hypothetical protein